MTIKERLDSLRNIIKGKIKPESTQDELTELNSMLTELDEIEKDHNLVVEDSAKYKDTIVKMVLNQGDGKKPSDDSNGSEPKSMDEFLAEFKEEHKEDK